METELTNEPRTDRTFVTIIYVLYFVGFFIAITALVGVIMAHVKRSDADAISETHLQYQIRTFWIGLLMAVLATLTAAIGIGLIIGLLFLVWVLVRCIKGVIRNSDDRAIEDPATWLW
ncbi:DUF4870 domain-containing protein [Thioalkalivibrio sp. ALgr3]|uniref:DUF4870 family protein n=1 Tax=Thioalkalivibrio sp. ALgr3 TaxID=1239292 RepID=UPI000362ABCB|nr:DUF4870 domain-containing protein [Thioalkalivibrio sp. ALgr3]